MRYIVLVLLTTPIIFLAFLNIITKYKLRRITKRRFKRQFLLWSVLFVCLISSFPLYNTITGNPLLNSNELTLFDIFQSTAIIYLIYLASHQRQKIDRNEDTLKKLSQELSIRLSLPEENN